MSDEDFQKAYDFFSKDTKRRMRKVSALIDAELNKVDRSSTNYSNFHSRDFSQKINLHYKLMSIPRKYKEIENLREKVRRIRKY